MNSNRQPQIPMRSRESIARLLVTGTLLLAGACGDDSNPGRGDDQDFGFVDTGGEETGGSDVGDTGSGTDAESPDTPEPDGGEPDGSGGGTDGWNRCETDADCDDGLDCTTDACAEVEGQGRICTVTFSGDGCLIANVCRDALDTNPDNSCEICRTETPLAWSTVENGAPCDDGSACTVADTCSAGACGGDALSCDDSNVCTIDACTPDEGCSHAAVSDSLALACDDGLGCTENDVCSGGFCEGDMRLCDDGDPCTDEVCEEGTGCVPSFNAAACDDGNPCTTGDTCAEGTCGAGAPDDCDDLNQCTIDVCYVESGCVHLPTFNPCCTGAVSVCDDGDPCTTDNCDPETADCSYDVNEGPCDDGNACTAGDTCSGGTCAGEAVSCDDRNTCTDDSCNINRGCIFDPRSTGACDDGIACSLGEMCDDGICVATDLSMCVCEPTFSDDAAKITALALGANTNAGEALDIDGDGDRDNALGALGSFVNESLQGAVADGSLMMLTEFIDFVVGDFTLALHQAELAPTDPTCDYQTATCDYLATRDLLDADTCAPIVALPANWNGTRIAAGGPDTAMPFAIPLSETSMLNITLYMVSIEVTPVVDRGAVVGFSGLLGGAVTETDLNNAILSVDPASLPLPPDSLISLLGTLARNDIDSDGDGTLDAKSIGLKLTAIDGRIAGVVP